MGISINGPSGIDTGSLIEQLVALEQQKITAIQKQKDAYQSKINAYTKMSTFLSDIGARAAKLKSVDDFNIFKINSSKSDYVNATATTGGVPGSYSVQVFQTAQFEKLISTDKKIMSQTEKLSTYGISPGKFSINDVEITVGADDTIQDLRMKINSATSATGSKPNVSATVVKTADNNFRLILTSTNSGGKGAVYKDLDGGTVLNNLGIISATGDKGIVAQAITSSQSSDATPQSLKDTFNGLAAGGTIQYAGKDHAGNAVSGSFIKTATSTFDDFLNDMKNGFHGMIDAVSNVDGSITMTDKVGGISKLAVTSMSIGTSTFTFNTTATGTTASTVLSTGSDAYFSVDGIAMVSEKNSASGFISGVTLELKKGTSGEAASVSIDRDTEEIATRVTNLINSYNALLRWMKEETKTKDPKNKVEGGDLASDSTTRFMVSQVRNEIQRQFGLSSDMTYTSLSMMGLKTNINTGELEIDKAKLKTALDNGFDDVVAFFASRGYSDNPNVKLGTFTKDTQDGVYSLTETNDKQYTITRTKPASTESTLSQERDGEIVTFSGGLAKGLSLTLPAGTGSATFTFSKGLSGHLKDLIDGFVNGSNGQIKERQNAWNRTMESMDKRISGQQDRVEAYRLRLVKEFSNMETVLQRLKSQGNSMLNQIGSWNSSSSK